jgi:hypothetical protein
VRNARDSLPGERGAPPHGSLPEPKLEPHGGRHAHGEQRVPSHRRDDADRPKGTPTDERHATETAHAWEDEHHQPHRH